MKLNYKINTGNGGSLVAVMLLLCVSFSARAQDSYSWLVEAIDSNNTAILAYEKAAEAQKMQNQTGLTLPDPEIGANYLKLKPRLANQRFDYNISQSFEFPTVYGHRKSVSESQNQLVDSEFRVYRAELINDAINTYLEWVYLRELGEVLARQKEYAESIAASYQSAFEKGSINILDRNKARVNAISAAKEYEINRVELNSTFLLLSKFNRGQAFQRISNTFPEKKALIGISDENSFVDSNIQLQSLNQEVQLSQRKEKLAKAEWLPEFSVGFMREQDVEVDFKGVSFGMSLPLWQKKNTNKAAKLNTQALRFNEENTKEQYIMSVNALYKRTSELRAIMDDLEKTISQTRGLELLKKAMDLKEITILEYLVEQSMYFDLTQKYLETRKNYHTALAELYKWSY